jgi:hypothetical protein
VSKICKFSRRNVVILMRDNKASQISLKAWRNRSVQLIKVGEIQFELRSPATAGRDEPFLKEQAPIKQMRSL